MVVNDAPSVLWTLHRHGNEFRCEARLVPVGIQGRLLWNGTELYALTVPESDDLCAWAREKRGDLEGKGWVSADKEN